MGEIAQRVADLEAEVLGYRRAAAVAESVAGYELGDGRKLVVYPDPDPSNPRDDSCLFTFVFSPPFRPAYGDSDDRVALLPGSRDQIVEGGGIIVPVYYECHNYFTVGLTESPDSWDHGKCGVAAVVGERLREEYGGDAGNPEARDRAMAALEAEIAEYNSYLCGDVFGYRMFDAEWRALDGCWGFVGYDIETNGMAESLGLRDVGYKLMRRRG
jgi:hypothetical protein